ncbi:hypothetical protein T440DRAFT_521507 [Plenodomus tracheiphilus IPT5]|uniref:Uncharacterized protein n=1 Tax=Plenodomus tracheiphilus IPT5 TaxID=1408161 RepID=A0A6A7AX68_9PLEO|nr:hypothetical protein T440DRAFT_521507 [Plenodomus tracheiphilus IPT5]
MASDEQGSPAGEEAMKLSRFGPKFHGFLELPPGLRIEIWRLAVRFKLIRELWFDGFGFLPTYLEKNKDLELPFNLHHLETFDFESHDYETDLTRIPLAGEVLLVRYKLDRMLLCGSLKSMIIQYAG